MTRAWTGLEIAIVGMAGRFPGAPDLGAFWRNLQGGVDAISRLEPEALQALGRSADELADPAFVPAHGVLQGHDLFDAEFFGYRAAEADAIDPQQRIFLELAWLALEDAAIDPQRFAGAIAVFAGCSTHPYLHEQLLRNPAALQRVGPFLAQVANQSDHLAARVAYKLNLSGAAVGVQTACSTSLVAVHLAATQLLAGACDLALAGGVSLTLPRHWGYRHEEGMILSPDGRCRAFDAQAGGTLKGDGAGIVVLKRLSDALADGDRIDAVILASAINNDGAAKVGYTAPGQQGQARLIESVHAAASVSPQSIGYVEAHGTGTPLGDPIEVAALTQAFRRAGPGRGYCGLGSVKTGIGHLDAAAGVAGLIKATLALRHAQLPASLHFSTPNPQLDLPASPFFVVEHTQAWPAGNEPRRAGVSSFGIGGTNAHVLLEEAPPAAVPAAAPGPAEPHLLLLSARTPSALRAASLQLADHLQAHPELRLHDVARTLALGRHAFAQRRAVVASDLPAAVARLRDEQSQPAGRAAEAAPALVFMFPGQGAQYPGMARGLYHGVPAFREEVDTCCQVLLPLLGLDLRRLLLADGDDKDAADAADAAMSLQQTAITQPALFVVEFALARWLMALGLQPAAVAGHSVGEIVAACLAGVFSRDDALALVAARGRLMQAQPEGAMLAVPLAEPDLRALLPAGVDVAAVNGPQSCVAAGPVAAIETLQAVLQNDHGLHCTRLRTSHAFHSSLMDGALAPYAEQLHQTPRQAPTLRLASTVTGTWADTATLADPAHWLANLRQPVRFADAVQTLAGLGPVLLLEVGPGNTLGTLARTQSSPERPLHTAATLRHPQDDCSDSAFLLAALGRGWCAGLDLGTAWLGDAPWQRLALPGYPFERQRHWVDPAEAAQAAEVARPGTVPQAGVRLYVPVWQRQARPASTTPGAGSRWAVVGTGPELQPLVAHLQAAGAATVHSESAESETDWAKAWDHLSALGSWDHLLLLNPAPADLASTAVPALLRALAAAPPATPLRITLASRCAWAVLGDEAGIAPHQALAWGWLQVLPEEVPGVHTNTLDLQSLADPAGFDALLWQARHGQGLAAWRHGRFWRRVLAAPAPVADLAPPAGTAHPVVLIAGGLGAMGLAMAQHLAHSVQARLVLLGRRALPARNTWPDLLATQPGSAQAQAVRALQAIEAAGGELMLETGDVGDENTLRAVQERVQARFGPVQWLLHCAGVAGGGAIALQQARQAAAVLAPKVAGLDALARVFGGPALQQVVLCSSLTSWMARRGRSDYTAANLYLDAWALAAAAAGGPAVLSINWDNWADTGMARQAAGTGALQGLGTAQALQALDLALALRQPQVVVAARDLHAPQITQAALVSPAAGADAEPASGMAGAVAGRAAAPAASAAADDSPTARLLAILRDLLGAPQMGADDDFFAFGGDSVVSIQLMARARRAGLALNTRQVFELRTASAMAAPAGLPAAAGTTAAVATVGTRATTGTSGDLPSPVVSTPVLTPIQRWFFDLPLAQRGAWSLVLALDTPPEVDTDTLFKAARQVAAGHDALALRFDADGQLLSTAAGDMIDLQAQPLAGPDAQAWDQTLARMQDQATRAFDLRHGPLLRLLHAQRPGALGRLVVAAHHLVSDLIGLRAWAQDLCDTWAAMQRGEDGAAAAAVAAAAAAAAAPSGTSWQAWSARLHRRAQQSDVRAALTHWAALAHWPATPLPRDHGDAPNLERGRAQGRRELPLHSLPHSTRQQTAPALLAALGTALQRWSAAETVWIDVEGHGRDAWDDDLDVSRTMGWFTSFFPVVLRAAGGPAQALQQAAAALQAPHGGASHGWLRWLHDEPTVRAEMAQLPQPEVVLLYQGRHRAEPASAWPLVGVSAAHDPLDLRTHLFELNAWVAGEVLHIEWGYNREIHDAGTVEQLLDMLVAQLRQDTAQADTGAAPDVSDAPAALAHEVPLSFAQQRLWFLQRLNPDSTLFNKQAVLEIDGALDTDALAGALNDLVRRHDMLRTRFAEHDGVPWQRIETQCTHTLHVQEVVGADTDVQADLQARGRADVVFDLQQQVAFDTLLLRLAPQRHWLVLTVHHILADAWSVQVMLDELARFYSARRRGQAHGLPPLAIGFADYAQRQRQQLAGPELQRLLDYWTPRLAGLSPIELPTDRARPPLQRFDGGRVPVRWPAALTAAFRQLTREHGCSPFMGMLALYKLLLWRYTGQDDIVVGCTAADRPQVDTEGLVGVLVNNLVLRTDLSGEPDFPTLLARVREVAIGANEHRNLPFEKLVEVLRPTRDLSRAPLFQAMFAYMNVPATQPLWHGLAVQARELPAGGSEFDLSLFAYEPGNAPGACFSGWFEYATALFDAATIERLAGHLQQLAASVCAEPARRVALQPMLTAAEHQRIVVDWNRTQRVHPEFSGLHRLLEAQAARTPDAVAVVCEDTRLSYAQLHSRANRLARLLRARGVGAESRVVLCTDRTSAMMVGLLAILKAGGAYVPVDPGYPPDRIAGMLQDCEPTVVLTQARWLDRLGTGATLCIDRDAALFETLDDSTLPDCSGRDNLAYLIYTSGSTGRPKGVQIEHASALNLIQTTVREPGVAPSDVLLAISTVSFDIALFELFAPLAVGARVLIASRETASDGQRLLALLQGSGTTLLQATPSAWRMLVDAGWAGTPGLKMMSTGEPLTPELKVQLLARGAELWNLSGPTEITVWNSFERVLADEPVITVGKSFDNMRAYVLDRHDQPLPAGVPGELVVGGVGVSRGYLKRPELNAQKYCADPFVPGGGRLFRCGDLVRWRGEGRIEVLGRLDHQVKLRGYRIELGEIEVVLAGHAAVALCLAMVREDRPGDQRLVVYAVPRGSDRPGLAEMRRFASDRLPEFMLPAALVWLDRLPQTPNGKVDRKALPVPAQAQPAREEAPLSAAEQRVADVFAQVLGCGAVGRYDNFFDLGGHSLLVMKVVERLRQGAGIELIPGELFQQTVGQIAQHHGQRLAPTPAPAAAPAPPSPGDGVLAFFFDGSAGTLYACLHQPQTRAPDGPALLVCAASGHEYTRGHRALKQLAVAAAAAGMPALRFDYHGSGDAAGEAEEFSLAQARADIGSAIDELRRRSGSRRVCVVGLRLGATLALQVALTRPDVDTAILWAPVWDGAALLADWRAQQQVYVGSLGYGADSGPEQALGVPLPAALVQEIGALGPPAALPPGGLQRVQVLGDAPPAAWRRALQDSGAALVVQAVEAAPIWRQEPLQAVVPQGTLRHIVSSLQGRP